jgi:hypothetical protein
MAETLGRAQRPSCVHGEVNIRYIIGHSTSELGKHKNQGKDEQCTPFPLIRVIRADMSRQSLRRLSQAFKTGLDLFDLIVALRYDVHGVT